MTLRIGLVQTRTPATAQAALDHVGPMVARAAAQGAGMVITPEATNILQRNRDRLLPQLRSMEEDLVVASLRDQARAHRIWLLIGSALVLREDGRAANRSILIDPTGAIAATYDKLHMFDVDLPTGERARESEVYAPGDRAVVVGAAGVRLGLTICYDVRFPALHRALALAGAEILTVPAAFTRPTGEAHWEVLLRARAIETGSFVLAPAQGGEHEDGRATYGHTLAVSPWGRVLGRLDHDQPGVLMLELDLDEVSQARNAIPNLRNARPFSGP